MKHTSPQETVNEFWAKFNTKTPGKASTILPLDVFAQKASDQAPKGIITGHNSQASYEDAVEICKAKVAKIVKECRRTNEKYRDPYFDIEFDLKWGRRDCLETLAVTNSKDSTLKPQSVKRVGDIFEKPIFFIDGPTADDIRQGNDGDCWLMAALCTLGNKPGMIERVCVARDEAVGVYGFVFFRDFEWRSEIIDDKLYLTKPDYDESYTERILWEDRERITGEEDYRKAYQSSSGALYFSQCNDPNETWLPLLEKAYAKAHGDYMSIEGGYIGEGIEDLTGGVTTELFATDILDEEAFWTNELMKVNEEFLFGCATGLFKGWGERKGIREGHAYSITKAVEMEGHRLLLLKNPWGKGEWTGPWSDGSSQWTPEWMHKLNHRFGNDGAFWISYEDFLKKYQTFDRTRLFSPEWKVTQQWTKLKVPWTVGYHETKFAFTLSKPSSVVIVLSQLDTRYFKGLEGQYTFELGFRIHKAGEEDYIVRSHANYCMRRSVSAELDLDEAGEYNVLVKIKAERSMKALPVEQVIRENCRYRRDKLLRIGLAYDLAHAKGKVEESVAEKAARQKAESRQKSKERNELKEKLLKDKRRKKQIANKLKKKNKAKKAKEDAKAAAKAGTKIDEKTKATTPHDDGLGNSPLVTVDCQAVSPGLMDTTRAKLGLKKRDYFGSSASKSIIIPLRESSVSVTNMPSRDTPSPSVADDDDDDSDVSSISSYTIDEELARTKNSDSCCVAESGTQTVIVQAEEEEDEFERDPWNAVAVVGLRVYSKDREGDGDGDAKRGGEADKEKDKGKGVSIKVVRPKNWEDGEASLDVDNSAADATLRADCEECRRGSVMGFRGRLGSVVP